MRISLLLATTLLLGACNDYDGPTYPYPGGDDDGTGGGSNNGSGSGSGSGGSTSPASPKILSIATNTMTLHEGEQLVVTAVVTDPNGIDDVIGGQLSTTDGTASYGSFATDASEGAYSISLGWSAIDVARSIDTEKGMAIPRQFRATFFDAEGNSTFRDVTISLQCQAATDASCSGTCTDMSVASDDHCGSCGHVCPTTQGVQGACNLFAVGGGTCLIEDGSEQRVACSTVCVSPFAKCYGALAAYEGQPTQKIGCTVTPAATYNMSNFTAVGCLCGDNRPCHTDNSTEGSARR